MLEKPKKKPLFKLNTTPKIEEPKEEVKKPQKSPGELLLEKVRNEIKEQEIIRAKNIEMYKERGKAKRESNIAEEKETKPSEYYFTPEYRREYYLKNTEKFAERNKKYKEKIKPQSKLIKYHKLLKF